MLTTVRKYDSPSHTLQAFIPSHVLPAYLAIRAFNVEVTRIPDLVSNSTVGAMRMQFWRDTINSAFDNRPKAEPVAILLHSVLASCKLNKSWFLRTINARERHMVNPRYATMADLESYAENTYSTLLYLTLAAYPLKSVTMDHLASHIGKAAGISAVLRGFPILAFPPAPRHQPSPTGGYDIQSSNTARGIITLPLDTTSTSGLCDEDVYRKGSNAEGLKDAIFNVATRASDHLITLRSMVKSIQSYEEVDHAYEHENDEGHEYGRHASVRVSAATRKKEYHRGRGAVLGPAVSTQLWLDRLQKCDFDIFHPGLRRAEWRLPFVAWWKFRQDRL